MVLGESMETPAVSTKTVEVPTAETSETASDDFAQVFESKETTKDDDEDLEDYFKTLAADS